MNLFLHLVYTYKGDSYKCLISGFPPPTTKFLNLHFYIFKRLILLLNISRGKHV